MREPKKHYLEFMQIELQDLREDIEFMIEESKKRLDAHQITERVYRENTTLFQNELLSLNDFQGVLLVTEPRKYETLDEMIDYLKNEFKQIVKTRGLAEAILVCIDRKLVKVAQYIKQD